MALTQISTAGVKDDAVTSGKIPANAVGSSELADNAVDTAAIANNAVTNSKLASSFQAPIKIAVLHDERTYDTYGGQGTASTFNDRVLNTEHFDPDNIVTLSSNQFTLQAGTYIIEWSCPTYRTNRHIARLYNVTTSAAVENGTSVYANTTGNDYTTSDGITHIVLTDATVFKVQSYIATTSGTADFGVAHNVSSIGPNIYTVVKITKLA